MFGTVTIVSIMHPSQKDWSWIVQKRYVPIVEAFSVIADRHNHSVEGFPGKDILSECAF